MQQRPVPDGSVTFPIADTLDLRIAISRMAKLPWMELADDMERGLLATIVSELGTNILKYAGRGKITLAFTSGRDGQSVEISARDYGPGIDDIALAMKDHFTTGHTLGLGLPGVRRMADGFSISSKPGQGTLVIAQKTIGGRGRGRPARPALPDGPPPPPRPTLAATGWEAGAFVRPMPGTIRGGDLALIRPVGDCILLAIADVTGHGERAHSLRGRIESLVQSWAGQDPALLMRDIHATLIGTIGAAVGLLLIDTAAARFSYVGVGNTGVARVVGDRWRGVSKDGLLGSRLPGLLAQDGALDRGDTFLMWTDGISELQGPRYAQENRSVPAQTLARNLATTLGKPHDDAGCVLFRWL